MGEVVDSTVDQARARSHPLRLALLELLAGGPRTASEAAAALGTNTGATSFHLRQLARYGLVEVAESADSRLKPWRLVAATEEALDRRDDERYAQWRSRRQGYPVEWQRQAAATYTVHLTPAELDQLAASILDLVAPYFDREQDPSARPPDSAPVALVTRLFPLVSPEEVIR
ncbi:helix-turn-helix domain-containing protein [Fodinicola acaciae]|uniref:helix-turn-helix domain-containing protein n=1 Tax=Fodinicola acaciae TaxID=2681555 RepID=UPI0013D2CED5|nr:helix-turn-helix domain-containing protein [Fodinicola acaciae]